MWSVWLDRALIFWTAENWRWRHCVTVKCQEITRDTASQHTRLESWTTSLWEPEIFTRLEWQWKTVFWLPLYHCFAPTAFCILCLMLVCHSYIDMDCLLTMPAFAWHSLQRQREYLFWRSVWWPSTSVSTIVQDSLKFVMVEQLRFSAMLIRNKFHFT